MPERSRPFPIALSIGSVDCTGSTGIPVDLRTYVDHQVHGACAVTAVTTQAAHGVRRVDLIPTKGVRSQLQAVLGTGKVSAVKVGMLATPALVGCVTEVLRAMGEHCPPVVVDPALTVATNGELLDRDTLVWIEEELLPLATLVTPNHLEAAAFRRAPPGDLAAIHSWVDSAPCAVLLTGGEMDGTNLMDTLFRVDHLPREWSGLRIPGRGPRGAGTTLSAAITARLALGDELDRAVDGAITYTRELIKEAARRRGSQGAVMLPHGVSTGSKSS